MASAISHFDQESMLSNHVYIRKVRWNDRNAITKIGESGKDVHYPWITPPLTNHMFRNYIRRLQQPCHEGFVGCLRSTNEIVGVINLNDIVRGTFLNANISYYVNTQFQGRGFMTEALYHVINYSFTVLGLHRIEAAIQPNNTASKRLIQRCGFVYEGLAHDFLYIDGQWRDHERWALIDRRDTLTRV